MATDDDRLELRLTTFELLAAAQGRHMTCRLTDGQEVILRLATPVEAMEMHVEACRVFDIEPTATYEQMAALVKPLPS